MAKNRYSFLPSELKDIERILQEHVDEQLQTEEFKKFQDLYARVKDVISNLIDQIKEKKQTESKEESPVSILQKLRGDLVEEIENKTPPALAEGEYDSDDVLRACLEKLDKMNDLILAVTSQPLIRGGVNTKLKNLGFLIEQTKRDLKSKNEHKKRPI